MKVLINTPDTSLLGGVANHYKGLFPYWKNTIHYNYIGSRKRLPGIFCLPFDLVKFAIKLSFGRYDAVVLNPSLIANATIRDGLFLMISCFFSVKKIVFFHGWESEFAEKISRSPKLFSWIYGRADCFIVLASSFKRQLLEWGIHTPTFLTTTKFDDRLIVGRDIRARHHVESLLFLARIEEEKGIFVALSAFQILQSDFPDLRFKVVGNGGALEDAKRFVIDKRIDHVEFCGVLSGSALSEAFTQSDIYLLPTWHGEGMPTSILEAMAFGLPVITRPVGGICDFFIDGDMGELISSKNPEDFALAIRKFLESDVLLQETSEFNKSFARDHFAASKVARSLESIFYSTLEEKSKHHQSK